MALPELHSVADALAWLAQRGARQLATDSRRVAAGDAFIAWPGHASDARQYVGQALEAGAVACLVESDGAEAFSFAAGSPVAALRGLKAATGEIVSAFMGHPSGHLAVVASTGTNGKTSTAWWVAQALTALGRRCGVIGTLGVGEPPRTGMPAEEPLAAITATGLTTPDPVTLHGAFRRFAADGFAACAIEASSIGLVEHRLAGTRIQVALFTNFTQDHLDFHGSMEAYWDAKAQLFTWPGLQAAAINLDDEQGATLAEALAGSGLPVWTYSMHRPARLRAQQSGYADGGLGFQLIENGEGGSSASVHTRLIGDYNVSNLLAVIGALRALGIPLADAARACADLTPVPGRMQRVAFNAGVPLPDVVVDYAHTPDALDKALRALRPLAEARGGRLWCVFGCGGNRDAGKRPLMGALAQRLADQVVVTSDNPRHEAPALILSQILAGMVGHEDAAVIEDRRAAIAHAVQNAGAGDVVLVAGKGHEDYQDVAGRKLPFSDVAEALAALQKKGAAA
jgi:UDP-N-acetylmuramyl-tripeptide synthetase